MKTSTRILALPALLLAAAAGLAACGGNGNPLNLPVGSFRVVNAISDSSSLDARASGLPSDINNITVNTASGFRQVPDSTFRLDVTVNTPSGARPTFSVDNIDIDRNAETTAYLPGTIAAGSFARDGFFIKNAEASIGTGQTEVTLVDASSAAGTGNTTLTFYLTAPTVTTVAGQPSTNVGYRTGSAPTQVAAASYRLRITAATNPAVVIFDSGTAGFTLAPGARVQIAAINESDATRNSPIQVLIIPSDSATPVTLRNTP